MREQQKIKASNMLKALLNKKWITSIKVENIINDIDKQSSNRAFTYHIYGSIHLYVGREKEKICSFKFL